MVFGVLRRSGLPWHDSGTRREARTGRCLATVEVWRAGRFSFVLVSASSVPPWCSECSDALDCRGTMQARSARCIPDAVLQPWRAGGQGDLALFSSPCPPSLHGVRSAPALCIVVARSRHATRGAYRTSSCNHGGVEGREIWPCSRLRVLRPSMVFLQYIRKPGASAPGLRSERAEPPHEFYPSRLPRARCAPRDRGRRAPRWWYPRSSSRGCPP